MDSRNLDKGRKFNVYRGIIKILVEFDSPWSHYISTFENFESAFLLSENNIEKSSF